MVFRHPELFICSNTNPLFQRIVNLNLRPDDVVPFPTAALETIVIESRGLAVRIRMENYMRQEGYSEEEIQRVAYPNQRPCRSWRNFIARGRHSTRPSYLNDDSVWDNYG